MKIDRKNVLDYAILAKNSYEKDILKIEDIHFYESLSNKNKHMNISSKENAKNGFQAKVYKNDSNEIVIAYAGSSDINDFINDYSMLIGKIPDQLTDAIKLYEDVRKENPNAKITLTGHSLGGMLATQVALDSYKKQMIQLNGVNKENFNIIKDQINTPKVVAFESPSIFLPLNSNETWGIWDKNKDVLQLFGYEMREIEIDGKKYFPLVYAPKEDSLDIHDLGIVTYQNKYGFLTQKMGYQIGAVNLIDKYKHGLLNHFIDDVIKDLLDKRTVIEENAQEIFKNKQHDVYNDISIKELEAIRKTINYANEINETADKINDIADDYKNNLYLRKQNDPIVLDLKNNGIEHAYLDKSKSYFNLNNYENYSPKVEWIVSHSDDGFLCIDKNENGIIDNGQELFTERQLLSSGELSKNGIEVLKDMDTNHDGMVDKNDENFHKLLFWNDANNDGVSQKEELHSLDEVGVEKFIFHDTWRNSAEGRLSNGKYFACKDVQFTDNKADSIPLGEVASVDWERIEDVPYISHIGFVDDSWRAATKNPALQDLFRQYHQARFEERDGLLDQIVCQWAGTADIADEMERKRQTACAFGALDANEKYFTPNINSRYSLIKDMVQVMDFFQSDTGAKILNAYEQDVANDSKGYELVKQEILSVGKKSANEANIAMNSFYQFINKSDMPRSKFYDRNKFYDFQDFMKSNVFVDGSNFKAVASAFNRGKVTNIHFDSTVDIDSLDLRQVSGRKDLAVRNLITKEEFVIGNFADFDQNRELNFNFSDGSIWQKADLQTRYVCKSVDENDTSRLITSTYSSIPQFVRGNNLDNDILVSLNTTIYWGKGEGNDTVHVSNAGKENTDVHLVLEGLNREDVEFRRGMNSSRKPTDLYIIQKDTGEKLKINYFFDKSYRKPTDITFADGTVLDMKDILAQEDAVLPLDSKMLNVQMAYQPSVNQTGRLLDVESYGAFDNTTPKAFSPNKTLTEINSISPYLTTLSSSCIVDLHIK